MDTKQILKDQVKQAVDNDDFATALALIQALQAIGSVTVSPSPQTTPGKSPLVYTGPPSTDPVLPPDEQPQATDFDLQRLAQMDEKDVRLHHK